MVDVTEGVGVDGGCVGVVEDMGALLIPSRAPKVEVSGRGSFGLDGGLVGSVYG